MAKGLFLMEISKKGKIHDVYWGSHGCKRVKGHAIPCICDCNMTLPTGHLYVFGDDKDTAVFDPKRKVDQ